MFKSIANWWNRKEIAQAAQQAKTEDQIHQLMVAVENIKEQKESLEEKLENTTQELEEASSELQIHRSKAEADEARRTGSEPWVEIKSDKIDDVKGIQIELDWNDAFVTYLRDNGVTAKTDEAVVQKWLLTLYQNIIHRMEDELVENTESGTI